MLFYPSKGATLPNYAAIERVKNLSTTEQSDRSAKCEPNTTVSKFIKV